MALHGSLQQLSDLDKTSPQFYEQLSNLLRGNRYQDVVPHLQSESLAWLVEYLDGVRLSRNYPPPSYTKCRRRFSSVLPIMPALCSRKPCTSLGRYAASNRFYRNRAHFQNHSLGTCMRGHSMVPKYASDV